MIPIPVVWTNYTATASGRVVKLVPCEHCSTEYVYVLERQGEGAGTSFYLMNEGGAQVHAADAAQDTLRQYLENDFDPVPCPVCGHSQRYMFPKLYTGSPSIQLARLAVLVLGCVAALGALYWTITYAERAGERTLARMVANWSLLGTLGLIGVGLGAVERAKARRFDPNLEDQQARIEKGRVRAITRAEFEAAQQREREARDQFIEYLRQKAQQDKAKSEDGHPRPDSG
jgi:hypothetical protein